MDQFAQLSDSMLVRKQLRNQMPVASQWAYFDHAAVAPLPNVSSAAGRILLDQSEQSGDACWPEWSKSAGQLRIDSAELLGCSTEEIALIPNTTFGINLIAEAYPWFAEKGTEIASRDTNIAWLRSSSKLGGSPPNVVVIENEFSSNLIPWLQLEKMGVEVRRVPAEPSGVLSLEKIRERLDSSTRLLSISWVNYLTGYRIDLDKLCELAHGYGVEVFLDAIQGLGVFPCNLAQVPVDYLAADGHKWLLGPEGAGVLFIRRKHLEKLRPTMIGWNSVRGAHHFQNDRFDLKSDASRFEGGSANHLGMVCLQKSMQLLLGLGCARTSGNGVMDAVMENAARLEEGLRQAGAEVYRDIELAHKFDAHLSGIVLFAVPNCDPNRVREELIRNKVMLSVRHGRLRAATHAYNNDDDIERICEVVCTCRKSS